MNVHDSQHERLSEDLADMAAALDALGAHERSSAAGLEDRLFAGTRVSLTVSDAEEEPARMIEALPSYRTPRGGVLTPMRLAAAIALCSAGAAVWLATLQPGGAPGTEVARAVDELDPLLALAWGDDGWSSFRERIDLLSVETEAVADSLLWDWGGILTEGSM